TRRPAQQGPRARACAVAVQFRSFASVWQRGLISNMAARDATSRSGINKPGLLTLTIKDKSALYLAYMPFVKNGGLFIPTNSNYRLGDEVFMLLNLMGEDEK